MLLLNVYESACNERHIWKRLGRHGNATVSKAYVAVTLHERLACDRAA